MDQLHFLHPIWLLALLPLALLWWMTARSKMSHSKAWEKIIDANLLPLLLSGSNEKHKLSESLAKWLLAFTWIMATIALADPVWEKVPRPIFQTNSARIIVLDLSNSMQIADLKPSRIARARFKIEDILSGNATALSNNQEEGQIGLVLFAGDAFTASPLTRDSETIRALLQVLSPSIMPSQGSRVDLGLQKAHELLAQAGVKNGQVLLIADGVSDQDKTLDMAKKLRDDGHRLSVLAVGTELGGELPQIKYQNGDRITVALDSDFLQAIAETGGGQYHLISTNNADLKSVLSTTISSANTPEEQNKEVNSDDWESSGPLIILLLLPLAALAFRRGWLFNILISASLFGLLQPQPVLASPLTESFQNGWNNLWINKEQENYTDALEEFKQVDSADARYNEGNTLAKLEKYQEAINAYDKALKLQPDMEDAQKNKAAIDAFLKKKQEQQQKNESDKNSGDKSKEQKEGDSKKGKDNEKNKANQTVKEDGEQSKNQFSDANKDLENPKEAKDEQDETKPEDKKSDDEKQKKEDKDSAKKSLNEKEQDGTKTEAKELSKEEKMAAEQWLRRIPDDPGGLLRRKFKQQYQQRRRPINDGKQPW